MELFRVITLSVIAVSLSSSYFLGDSCDHPQNPPNAFMLDYRQYFPDGTKIRYACDNGYTEFGDNTITCNGGNWTETNFECLLNIAPYALFEFFTFNKTSWLNDQSKDLCAVSSWVQRNPLSTETILLDAIEARPIKVVKLYLQKEKVEVFVRVDVRIFRNQAKYEICQHKLVPADHEGPILLECNNTLARFIKIEVTPIEKTTLSFCEVEVLSPRGLSETDACSKTSLPKNFTKFAINDHCIFSDEAAEMTMSEAETFCASYGAKIKEAPTSEVGRQPDWIIFERFALQKQFKSFWISPKPRVAANSCYTVDESYIFQESCDSKFRPVCESPRVECGKRVVPSTMRAACRSKCDVEYPHGRMVFDRENPFESTLICSHGFVASSSEPYRCGGEKWNVQPECVNSGVPWKQYLKLPALSGLQSLLALGLLLVASTITCVLIVIKGACCFALVTKQIRIFSKRSYDLTRKVRNRANRSLMSFSVPIPLTDLRFPRTTIGEPRQVLAFDDTSSYRFQSS